jgi:F-type H+-transporting ATPase subunit a
MVDGSARRRIDDTRMVVFGEPVASHRRRCLWILCRLARRLAKTSRLPGRISHLSRHRVAPHPTASKRSSIADGIGEIMNLSSDQSIIWQHGALKLNGTIASTWGMMIVMTLGAKMITRHLAAEGRVSRWQAALEIIVTSIEAQIGEVGLDEPRTYLAFLGTLFLFVATASLCTMLPGFEPPTGSLSTTTALAICVFLAVPLFGIRQQGFLGYLETYTQPTVIMLPFNIISELSRTLALAVRLFGNMMSGAMIIGILLTITPLLFPLVMTALGLLTGMVQAYIFSILAAVYIAAATRIGQKGIPHG